MCCTQRAVLYARYSPRPKTKHGRQLECESIEVQLERLQAWALSLGIEIVGTFTDEDMSGADAESRPGLQEALQCVCKEKCILAVYSLSRLARNTSDAIAIADRIQKCGADLASLSERIDTSTPSGRFFFTVMAAMAQLEREQTAQRTSDAMLRHQAAGRRMGGQVPYGKSVDPKDATRLVDNRKEIKMVEDAVRIYGRLKKVYPTCVELDKLGYKRRNGEPWAKSAQTLKNILEREGVL